MHETIGIANRKEDVFDPNFLTPRRSLFIDAQTISQPN